MIDHTTPAVAYIRKSTKGQRQGRQKQEHSLAEQRAEVVKLATGRFSIKRWFEDEGISGWKRGANRPDFQRMLATVQELGAVAILCDNLDRFTRASYDDVQEDTRALRRAGVRWIVAANGTEYHIGHKNDIGEIVKFAAAVWAAHEFSRQLARRIALTRKAEALKGNRTGGRAPYAMEPDGPHGLRPGDPEQRRILLWIYERYANDYRSANWIAADLNARGIPGPFGGRWYVKTVNELLAQPAYRGDFVFNRERKGRFFSIDAKGEVVDREDVRGPGKRFVAEGRYEPIVPPALWDKVQRRRELLSRPENRGLRKRMGYALTGVLRCGHCRGGMYGATTSPNGKVIYRCVRDQSTGKGACGNRRIREELILPFVLRLLGEEIRNLQDLLTNPPDALHRPHEERTAQRKKLEARREKVSGRIARAMDAQMDSTDKRTRQEYDRVISGLRDELADIDGKLATAPASGTGYTQADVDALSEWWTEFEANAVSLPIQSYGDDPSMHLHQDPMAERAAILVDPRKVNAALMELGCRVTLWWTDRQRTTSTGKPETRHDPLRGRFQLGQRQGELPRGVFAPSAGRAR
jgi:DNA invertase Pin-like site-specific DNA recombinase